MPLNHVSKYAQLTDEQFQLLGRTVVEWSNIEFVLGQLLTRLLHTPNFLGRTYTDQLTAHRIEVAITNALEVHQDRYSGEIVSEDLQSEIANLLSRVRSSRSLRNKVSHLCWARETDEAIFGVAFSGKTPQSRKLNRSEITLSTSELEDFCHDFYEIVEELTAAIQKIPEITEEEAISILRKKRT